MGHKVRLSKKGKEVKLFASAQQAGAEIAVMPVPSRFDHEWSAEFWRTENPSKRKEDDEKRK